MSMRGDSNPPCKFLLEDSIKGEFVCADYTRFALKLIIIPIN